MKTTSRSRPRGSIAIEFALVVPLILAFATGIIEYGWYFSRAGRVVHATRDAARVGVTYASDPSSTPSAAAEARAQAALSAAGVPCEDGCTIVATDGFVDGLPSLTVSVSVPYTPLTGLIPAPEALAAELTMAIELRDP